MAETEGVIKYVLEHTGGPPPAAELVRELDAWRSVLHRLRLLGQDPQRYHGLGFGNVSRRLEGEPGFVISGTQTGGPERLGPERYCLVTHCDPASNRIVASGPVQPSSEALTHGALYAATPAIACVLHVHSPELWQRREALGLPATAAEIPYGTPAMAAEVQRLLAGPAGAEGIFAMAGHEDGIVAFGSDVEAAGRLLVAWLARALALT